MFLNGFCLYGDRITTNCGRGAIVAAVQMAITTDARDAGLGLTQEFSYERIEPP